MALRELTDAEWQHSFVPVLRLAGPGSSTPSGDADPRSREHAVGDVKHVMDKTIGKRCCRISGAVSAANYLEVPRVARTAPLNLTRRFVYIQVRPIGTKPMTFHLDVLDSDGQPTRATFSTLYSESPAVSAAAEPFVTSNGGHGRDTTPSSNKHANCVAGVPWKGGGGSSGGGGCAERLSPSRALVRRGGALRCPVFFDTSRSFGWTVVAVDLVKLMSQDQGQAGGKGYKSLRGVRLGANMVVRGVYVSDCVYSPRTLPKEMAFRIPGKGDRETAYGWLWLPEVPEENAGPPPPPPPLQDGVRSNRPAWPPGAESPTSSVAAADAAEARGRRRMEKRHFQTRSSSLGKLLAHDVDDGGDDEAAAVVARNDRAAGPPSPRRAQGGPPVKKLSAGSAGGAAPASVSWKSSSSPSSKRTSLSMSPVRGTRARSKSVGAGGRTHPSTPPRVANAVATPTRIRPANASAATGAATPRGKTPSRVRNRGHFVPSPIAAATNGRPPLSPKVGGPGRGTPTPRVRRKKAFFCDGDGDVVGDTTTCGVDGGDSHVRIARDEQRESWTRREREDWAPDSGDRTPATPSVAVLGATGRAVDKSGWSERNGGPDPPVVTRVLPLGLENHRPNPPEFEPDPALHLERSLGYTGGLPETLAFLGGSAFVAFPSNNVIVLIETPVMPEPFFPARSEGNTGAGGMGDEKKADDEPLPAPHAFLRGHTDTVTLLRVSNGGHLLASAQGNPLGAAGGHGIVRIWDTSNLGYRAGAGDGGGGGKCFAHFEGHRWGVTSMCFSSDDRLLCTVGGDEHRRTQVVVWDVGILCAARAGSVQGVAIRRAIVARQISDFPITRILFSPFEKLRLVSCGRENVRFWRIRRQHLPACPAVLNDFARDLECTDLAFQRACHGIAGAEGGVDWGDGPCVVYVSSRVGTVLQVSYHTRNLLCVLQLHDEPIMSLTVTEWCAITCSADKLLRLWPLDFSEFLMEAAHESSVVSACSSGDGLKLAVGTAEGSIGVLDVMTHGYTTALRSHRGSVTAAAVNPCPEREEFATVSEDCTVRVWDLVTGAQLYQFSSPEDEPTCIAYAPPCRRSGPEESFIATDTVASKWGEKEEGGDEAFPRERHLVAGYASGAMRVFDVPTANTVFECQQHDSAVHEVVFTPDGIRIVSAGADGLMCVYDASRGYLPTRVVACDTPEPGCQIRLAVSPGSDRLAVIGTEPSCILLYELSTMVLKRRLGKPGKKGIGVRSLFGVASGGCGTGMGGTAPRSYRSKSYDSVAAGAGIGAGGADFSGAAMSGSFLHAEFSGDGSEILACTATKLFRFPLGSGDMNAWSSLLPCKAGPAVGACYPPSGPGLVIVSPATVVGAGSATDTAIHGSKRGATPRGVGGGGSELFLSRVHRDDKSSSVALSVPQAFAAHAAPLTAVAFSPVGDRLVTCDSTGVVLLWTNLAAPRPEAWATSRTFPSQDDASRVAANDGVRRAGGNLFSGKHGNYCDDHGVGAAGVGSDAAVMTNATTVVVSSVRPMAFPESDDDEEDQEENEESLSRDGMFFDYMLPASSGGVGRIPAPLDLIVSNGDHGGESEEAKWREMGARDPELGVEWARAASARAHRGRGGTAAGLPPLAPVTPSGRRGRGDGLASMLDQPPSPVVVAEVTALHGGFDRAASGNPHVEGGPRPSGQFSRALASLQTAVNEAVAAVGEAEGGAAESTCRRRKEEEKCREANRSFEISSPVSEDGGLVGCFGGAERMRVGVGEPLWSKDENVRVGERFDSKKPNLSVPASAAAVAVREATSNQGGEAECVTWQPSSGRLLYTQGDSLFAEELDSCRRWVLFDSCGPGARTASPVVAVSGCGEYIARASGRDGPNGVSGSRLSVWRLSRNNTASNSDCSGSSSDFGGGVNDQCPEVDLNYALPTVLEATEEDGIVALAFSPSGSEVCSLGDWDGSRCLLRTRLLSATACCSAGTIAGVSAINYRAVTSVTSLAAKTSAICVLPGRGDLHDGWQSFLIVTGGHEGVALWTHVRRGGKSFGVGSTGAIDGIRQCARESEGDGGLRLLGAYPGVRATALASVGKFVVAAEVFGAPGRVSVTAMDIDWLAAGGHHGDKVVSDGAQRPVDDEEFSWLAFGGSDDVSITSLATAGSQSIAVGGSGGKLEIWDMEAVSRDGGRTQKGARAGLVRRLDLRDALLGASVTDMTWDAGGTDAVLGAGGKIWHLHVPRVCGSHGTISPSNRSPAGEPTLARVWPGGNVQAG